MGRAAAVLLLGLLVACGDDAGSGDAGDGRDTGPADAGADAGSRDAGDVDAGEQVTAAVHGARCEPARRVGQVYVSGAPGMLYAYVALDDRPPPDLGDPLLTDASCELHDASRSLCSGCREGEVCTPEGTCAERPLRAGHVRLVLRAGAEEQAIEGPGTADAVITLPGATFTAELRGLGQVVTLEEMTVPSVLTGVTGSLGGTLDAPTAVDITWDAPSDPAVVFTRIPINHHVATNTFTECAVDASAGALHVDGAMLMPLAVATGLEFQGIHHVRFAAAETPIGCIEIRFFTIDYVSPG